MLRQLNSLFNRRERWQLGILSVALVIRAVVEMVGVVSIMPFMSVVAEPEIVQTNAYLNAVYKALGFTSATAFIMALGVALVAFLLLTLVMMGGPYAATKQQQLGLERLAANQERFKVASETFGRIKHQTGVGCWSV